MATATPSAEPPSKTDFVLGYLDDNPKAGSRAVNQAWNDAGYEGKISETLIHRMRSKKGLTGNLRAVRPSANGPDGSGKAAVSGSATTRSKPPKRSKRRGRPRKSASSSVPSSIPEPEAPRAGADRVDSMEADFDRLLFRVMDRGMPEVEEAIRAARRMFLLRQGG